MLINMLLKFFSRKPKNAKQHFIKLGSFENICFLQVSAIEIKCAKLENEIYANEDFTEEKKLELLEQNSINKDRLISSAKELCVLVCESDEVGEISEMVRKKREEKDRENILKMLEAKNKNFAENE